MRYKLNKSEDGDVGDVAPPEEDETHEDFIDRCMDAGADEESCEVIWDERSAKNTVLRKVHATDALGMEFILSDETPDRYDDVIAADGWDLKNFSKNPIALFNHNSDFPIGRWENLRVKDGGLRGHLKMAPEGTSARHDEIRRLIDAGILKAVSVGFRPIESSSRPDSKSGGMLYGKSELVETSLVSVPANPNALAVAKSLKISSSVSDLVFVKHDIVAKVVRPGEVVYEKRTTWGGKEVVSKYYPYVK